MADNKDKEKKTEESSASPEAKKSGISIFTWLIMAVLIGIISSSGYFLGRLFADSAPDADSVAKIEEKKESSKETSEDTEQSSKSLNGTWYYEDLTPVVVNPDEPGATRFIRVSLILEISNELKQDQAQEMLLTKNPLMINWLNLYFKSLSLDQMENEKDMKRILSQICDGFNEILFPEAKPQIKKVLIREFNIQ